MKQFHLCVAFFIHKKKGSMAFLGFVIQLALLVPPSTNPI